MYSSRRTFVESPPPLLGMKCMQYLDIVVGGHGARHNGGREIYNLGRLTVESPSKPVAIKCTHFVEDRARGLAARPHWGLKCTLFVEAGVGGVAARTQGGSEKSTLVVDLRRRPRRLRVGSAVCHESGGRGGEWGRARKLRCRSRGSRTLEGWDGVGWMDGAPAHRLIPTILTSLSLLEKISLVSRPSWLHPCKERRKRWEGRGEGAAAVPRWTRHIKFLSLDWFLQD